MKTFENKSVSVFTEFQPLEEVIIGRPHALEAFQGIEDKELEKYLCQIMHETAEDCDMLSQMLEKSGIIVQRPTMPSSFRDKKADQIHTKWIKYQHGDFFFYHPNPPLWSRDLALVAGNSILNLYSASKNRHFELYHYYDLFCDYFKSGANWKSMPPPNLNNETDDFKFYEGTRLLHEAANFLKCGKDIFYSPSANGIQGGKGTDLGIEWVKRELGDQFRFTPINVKGHLDGKIAIIRPGLILTWLKDEQLPPQFKNWDKIFLKSNGGLPAEFMELRKQRYYKDFVQKWLKEWIGYVDETYFDVNLLSIDEKTVITCGESKELRDQLKKYNVECIPFDFRHRYFWDGGIHCVSLDVRRKGAQEDYFR